MKTMMLSKLIDLALPLIVGILVPSVVDLLKRANTWLDTAPGPVKQATAFVVSALAMYLAQLTGIAIPTDLGAWDGTIVNAVIATLLGVALKQQKQVNRLKTITATMPAVAHPIHADPKSPFTIPPGSAP